VFDNGFNSFLYLGKKLRDELEQARIKREFEERKEQEELADKIRQQRAVNTVQKKVVKIFDPTEVHMC